MSRWKSNPNYYSEKERKAYGEAKRQAEQKSEQAEVEAWEIDIDNILPHLEGTEKQIAWAGKIRYCALSDAIGPHGLKPVLFSDTWEKDSAKMGIPADRLEEFREPLEYIREKVLPLIAEKSAKWWIDNREMKSLNAHNTLKNWEDIKAQNEKITEVKARRPERPERLVQIFAKEPNSIWNSTVYGSAKYKNQRIYINNNEYKLTPEEAAEIEAYVEARYTWKKELAAIKGEEK
jgi:hypothetical protein